MRSVILVLALAGLFSGPAMAKSETKESLDEALSRIEVLEGQLSAAESTISKLSATQDELILALSAVQAEQESQSALFTEVDALSLALESRLETVESEFSSHMTKWELVRAEHEGWIEDLQLSMDATITEIGRLWDLFDLVDTELAAADERANELQSAQSSTDAAIELLQADQDELWLALDECPCADDETSVVDTSTDADLDGWTSDLDCDDTDPDVSPDATEVADGIDNDCDGVIDDDPCPAGQYRATADSFGACVTCPLYGASCSDGTITGTVSY